MKELTDKFSNKISFDGRDIYLQFHNQHGRRWLGWFERGAFHTKRSEKHTFIERDSFGFNWHLLTNAKFMRLYVHCETGEVYEAIVQDILQDGKVLQFSKQGFELQIFYPIDKFRRVDGLVNHLDVEPVNGLTAEQILSKPSVQA